MRRSRAEWNDLVDQLEAALRVGDYDVTNFCREMDIPRNKMYRERSRRKRELA